MVNTSKILTVSYGTFSCTLEGFDDSFDTMKAIAEYFRDLAADDRYFGAEPPTPDADMLARIAEREIARRVEAHEDQGKIVLRAADTPAIAAAAAATTTPAAAAPQPEPVAEVEAPAETTPTETPAEISAVMQDDAGLPEVTPAGDAEEMQADAVAEETDAPVVEPEAEMPQPVEETPAESEPAAEMPEVAPLAPDMVAEAPQADATDVEAPAAEIRAETEAPEMQEEELAQAEEAGSPVEMADEEDEAGEDAAEPFVYGAVPIVEEVADEAVEPVVPDAGPEAPDAAYSAGTAADETAEAIETAEEFFEKSTHADETVYYEADEVEDLSPHSDPDSVAAKLSRIRSVVSQNDQPYEQGDYSEDEHAQDFLNDAAADLDAALAQDDEAELQSGFVSEAEEAVADDDVLASLPGDDADEDDSAEATIAGDETTEADADDGFEDTLSQLLADSMSDGDAPVETTEVTTEDTSGTETLEDDLAAFDSLDEAPAINDDDEARTDLNARVIKMKRDDVEAAIADGLLDDDGADDSAAFVPEDDDVAAADADGDALITGDVAADNAADEMDSEDQLLSPEEEEDLQRELAEVEADLVSDAADDAAETDIAETDTAETEETADEAAPVAAREGRHSFPAADENSDIERIFDEADSQLEKPESNQRRSAIQHLRAAVAATRAEKKAGADLQKDVDDSPYRSDLASVVRPRRPSTTDGARSERPSESRPAPLKLVAEQRIDTPREPIRPRRVSAAELNAASEAETAENSSNFSEFAEQMGATQLPDLLEAAAAYMSEVEGRDQFSRPMLMHKLQEVEKEKFSREDGLRSFGQLLRDGKIQKIKGGRFTVTEETEYRDEARQAG